mmetsp:Transcript_10155/g.11393  ORF Transcript_10155/g.11393 Transcript_10155/m.11393 type:complete len:103 (-) Transcript_10155:1520-1828(-)
MQTMMGMESQLLVLLFLLLVYVVAVFVVDVLLVTTTLTLHLLDTVVGHSSSSSSSRSTIQKSYTQHTEKDHQYMYYVSDMISNMSFHLLHILFVDSRYLLNI